MKKNIVFILLGFLTLSLLSCQPNNHKKLTSKDILIQREDGSTISVNAELAIDPEARAYGYMNRKNIPQGTGMIFVFEYDQILSFWMKNTPHPLSIAYIDARGQIRDIFNMTPFSLAPIESTVSVRYALEVPQGWFDENNVKVGDVLKLPD